MARIRRRGQSDRTGQPDRADMVGSESVRIIDGHRVGIVVAGEGEPIVLLHGLGRSLEDWSRVQPALAESATVYALDLEGFGDTERVAESLSLEGLAETVWKTLAALGETRPVRLVGNSLGGAVAMRMAADRPDSVAALVLVSSAGFGREASLGLRLMTVRGVGPALLRTGRLGAAVQEHAMFRDHRLVTRELIDSTRDRFRRPDAIRNYLEVVHALGAWNGIRAEWRQEVLEALVEADVPTLVLWGERDAVLPVQHLAAVSGLLPNASTRVLPDLGHAPQLEDPEGFVREVLTFLNGGDEPGDSDNERAAN